MIKAQLNLEQGVWLAINCGKFPSEKNCKLVMMVPEDQREDLLDAAVAHAVQSHGHPETPELREQLGQLLNEINL